jgi:myo-inositol-1(or 4)-monophosphatase
MRKITVYLRKIIRQASAIAKQNFKICKKGDGDDLVTDADLRIEKFLIEKLNKKYPDFDIISEEYNENNRLTDNCFIIDPLDGTINFANGLPLWGLQIACIENGETVSSVMYFPKLHQMYWADTDGAYCNYKKLHIADFKTKKPIYIIEGGYKFPALERMENSVSRNFRYLCCAALGCAWVAAGLVGAFILRKDNLWDYIPGLYLIKMAGGCTIDQPGAHIGAGSKEMCENLSRFARLEKGDTADRSKTGAQRKRPAPQRPHGMLQH